MTSTPSGHRMLLHGLSLVHAALRRSLDTVVRVSQTPIPEGDRAAFADFAARTAAFLRGHHDGEEQVVFPVLQKALERARLSDHAAEITAWRGDHEKLLRVLPELESAIRAYAAGGPQERVASASAAVRDLAVPHLDAEERAIDESVLAKAMSAEEAAALARSASQHGQKHGGPRMLMHFLHGLTDEEQREHFGGMPWFVRRVLVKRLWAPGYRPLLKYAHNRSIAL